ncbi:Oar protein [Acidisarcina polymorpha]|uniref:Oar protein n=1 Tax=Acidisarcina polymorpha TaxID=2211140 RepID=A0A2Z5G644_9BACT|nr:carboxypeptidase-like regulatory domain-containing protein [Acidisarcina polymorpha]AXC14692.1 Oar protein [Acidisarcina polymorpha]
MYLKIGRLSSSLIALLFLGFSCCSPGLAQQTLGGISGSVTDNSGGTVPGVAVTAVQDSTQLTRTANTNDNGFYSFVNLPIGTYTLTYNRDGFDSQKNPGILVQADRTVTLNVTLQVGSVNTSVEVDATPLMNATDTTNGYVLDKAQIDAVPLPTGSFTGLAVLSPGVNAELPGGTGANSGLGNAPIWANGQRDTSNSFLLNGVDASNLFNGKSTSQVLSARVVNNTGIAQPGASSGIVVQSSASIYLAIGEALPTPAPESIEEVRVNTSMYDAQQGSTSGAHIDMSTGSGTNQIHGTGYVHRGTDWLNAAPFFYKQDDYIPENEKVPQLHRYTAGGTVGAPILKDKLFGFLSYQHIHSSDQEIGISRLTVPFGLTDDRSTTALANIANTNFPFATPTLATVGSAPGEISTVADFLLNYKLPNGQYLVPSAGVGPAPTQTIPTNASAPGTAYFISDQAVADLDWNATKTDTVSAKYYYQHDPTIAPYAYSSVSGFTQHLDAGSQVASITNTLLLTPTLSTTQTIGILREKTYSTTDQLFTPAELGINAFGSTTFSGISIVDALGNSSPNNVNSVSNAQLNIGPGSASQGPFTGVFQNRIMPSANAIWTLGKHTLTFGGSYEYTQLNTRDERTGKGIIATADFSQFLQGLVTTNYDFNTTAFLQGDANRYYRANQVGAYVQDKFQVRSNLSLTAGVRYDWNGGLTEKYGRLYNFDPASYVFNGSEVTSNGFIIAGNNKQFPTKGVSPTTLTGRQWGIAPRLGFAWTPKQNDGKVVFRGGTGIYYDRGELFTYFSPGYAAGEITGGPFGVNQAPPFVTSQICKSFQSPAYLNFVPTCDPGAGYSLSSPWGAALGPAPTGNPADITNYLPSVAAIENGAQLFSFATYNRANKLPYTINFTFDMQWQPRNDLAITIGYVGNLGRHEVIPVPFNQAGIATPSSPINGQQYTYGYTVLDPNNNFAPINLPNGQGPMQSNYEGGNIDLRVPYIGYSAESESYKAAGVSAYNALQTHVEKRLSHGLQVGFSYTYSHALDEQSALGLFYNGNNPLNLRESYGSSDFDRTHVINFTYSYVLPAFFGETSLKGRLTSGWALSGITVIQSGQPYSVIDYSGAVGSIFYGVSDGITNPIVPLAPGCSPVSAKTGATGAFGAPALKASCFTLPLLSPGDLNGGIAPGDTFETNFTSGQRNIFRQSYQKRADISLAKNTQIREGMNLKYDLDIFNLTNTASFDIPINNVTQNENYNGFPSLGSSPLPGQPNSFYNAPFGLGNVNKTIGSPRQIQMALRLTF